MNCFVIMPFDRDFDDVYAAIRAGVGDAQGTQMIRCFRLDEVRPAGRITDRLLQEIQAATFCVADLTGNKPNVMWEVGYAMALGKPTIIVTQSLTGLPFDLKDMQTLEYNRSYLSRTLDRPLRQVVLDTLQALVPLDSQRFAQPQADREQLVGDLLEELRSVKSMVGQLVKAWGPLQEQPSESSDFDASVLEGAWVNGESGSHHYAKIINGQLISPYCYAGNHGLTGVYYGWKRTGEYWFGRFTWVNEEISGFAFLKQESLDALSGAWWYNDEVEKIPETPIHGSGVPALWERQRNVKYPLWAEKFMREVQGEGLEAALAAARTRSGVDFAPNPGPQADG